MPMVDTALYADQLAAMSDWQRAFDSASEDLDVAEENADEAAILAARRAITDSGNAWTAAAQEVGRRVHMQVEMIAGRHRG